MFRADPCNVGVDAIPVVGQGRIIIWEGASLWILEGNQASAELHAHAHHAIQLTFQLKGSFELDVASECLRGPVVAVASDALHSFRATGAVAFLFVAPESSVGRALSRDWFADRPWAEISEKLNGALEKLRQCFVNPGGEDDFQRLGREIVETLPTTDETTLPDPRVIAMINYAKNHLDDVVSLPLAAAHVCLSDSRARHLFVAQTGLPFKTYVLWLRLQHALALYAEGSPLTAAAHDAGFADSAHFSRTFKRTFGLPAAALRLYRN